MPDQKTDDPADIEGGNPEGRDNQPTEVTTLVTEEPSGSQEEKVLQVKHSDFKRIKDEARAKGRKDAISDLDAQAKAVGFADHADALKALAELKKAPPAKPVVTPPQPQGSQTMSTKPVKPDPKTADQQRLEAMKAAEERAAMRKQWRAEEKRRRELQEQLQAKDAEMALREEMYRAGVADVDYTIRLLTRQLEGKTAEEIGAFDRNAFYTSLRKEKPYLFGETVAPATTGTNGVKPDGSNPVTPDPGAAAVEQAKSNQFDARKAKPEDVSNRLRALGLNPHA